MPGEAERGAALVQAKGCLNCHSTDGSAKTGPSFQSMASRDDAAIAHVIRTGRGSMPKYDVSDSEVAEITAFIREPETPLPAHGGSFGPLAGSAGAFVVLHFVLSSIGVRNQVIAALGDKGFRGVYSGLSLLSFAGMIVFYRSAPLTALWAPPLWTRWIPVLALPLALFFLVAGFSTPSPTVVGQAALAAEPPRGIQAITRHPGLWGFAIWAGAHLATNGELRVILVAGAILVLALGGMLHIDARRRATGGDAWASYEAKTSILPFVAIFQKRATLIPAEIGPKRVAIAALLYLLLFFAHPYVIGASPAP